MRPIDADELMEKYHKTPVWDSWVEINNAPTIDAVPVVRCKDCKHSFERSERKPFGCYLHGKNGITLHDGDDFCSYGERKKSNE
mgnify:CR=1 FL=1